MSIQTIFSYVNVKLLSIIDVTIMQHPYNMAIVYIECELSVAVSCYTEQEITEHTKTKRES